MIKYWVYEHTTPWYSVQFINNKQEHNLWIFINCGYKELQISIKYWK